MSKQVKKKPPYEDTDVGVDRRRVMIDKLLQDYGADDVTWQTNYKLNQVKLGFRIEVEVNGVKRELAIQLEPAAFGKERKSWDPEKGYVMVFAPNWPQSMALLYYWLKAKLEAISYGFNSAEKELMAHVLVSLPGGGTSTAGEVFAQTIANGRLSLPEKKLEGRVID